MFRKINKRYWAIIVCVALLFNVIPINVEWNGRSYSNTLVAKASPPLGAIQDVFFTIGGAPSTSGYDPGDGYGNQDFVGCDGNFVYVSGLQFDLSAISDDAVITDARLGIEINTVTNSGNGVFFNLYGLDDDSWSDSSPIPSYGASDQIGVQQNLNGLSTPAITNIDVTSFVQAQLTDNAATFFFAGNSNLPDGDREFSFTCTANTDSGRTKPFLNITYYVPPSLSQVTGATLSSAGVASWNNMANNSGYIVQLYKNGSTLVTTATETTNVTTHNFLSDMRTAGVGTYTVKVTAKGDKTNYLDGPTSSASIGQSITQLSTVSSGLNWSGDVAHWTAVSNAVSYDVQLYKGVSTVGSPVNVLAANASAGVDFASTMSSNGGGTYTYKVTAIGDNLLSLDANQSAASNTNIKAIQLSTVSTPTLSSAGDATWTTVSNATGYTVQLYKDGVPQGSPITGLSGTTHNFLSDMRAAGAGNYTVQVIAEGDGTIYSNSSSSAASSAQTIVQLSVVSAGLTWTGNVAHWTAVSNAVSYNVQLYQGVSAVGSPVNVLAANVATGVDFGSAISGAGYGNFTYKVTAIGNSTLILDATQSAASNGNLKATPLAQVSNVVLSAAGDTSWDAVANASSYTIKLYKNGNDTGVSYNQATTNKNMLADMRANGVGAYTVKVTAVGDGTNYSNGLESVDSASQSITKLASATGLSWTGDTAHWGTVTNAVSYDVQLYKDGSAVSGALENVLAANRASGVDYSSQIASHGGGVYTYKVTAIGVNSTTFLDADQSSVSNDNIKSIQLAQVTNVALSAIGIASWDNVSHEDSFSIQLYKNGSTLGSAVTESADTLSHDFLSVMRSAGVGTYTVQVTAIGDGTYYTNGLPSVSVSSRAIAKLSTATSLTWTGNVAHFLAVTNASTYEVQLYKEGSAVVGATKTVNASDIATGADFATEIASEGAGNYTFKVTAKGDGLLTLDGDESLTSNTKIIAAPLAQVTGVTLSGVGVANWNTVTNASSYTVKLYKAGNDTGVSYNISGTNKDMLSDMRTNGVGNYTVKVTAIGDEVSYSDGVESVASPSQVVTKLATVTGLTWTGDIAHWGAVTNAASYDVQLYKDGSAVSGALENVLAASQAAGVDFSSQMASHGGGVYTYKVTAIGANSTTFLDADQSSVSNDNIKAIQLAQVTNVALSATGVASWDNVSHEDSFSVQLYKNGSALGSAVTESADTLSHSFLSVMRSAGVGTYTVQVTAIGDGTYYSNGFQSVSVSSRAIAKLSTATSLTWTGNVAHFLAVTNASTYEVKLYKEGNAVVGATKTMNASDLATGADFATEIASEGAGNYTFKVTAKGDGLLNLDGDESLTSNTKIVATPLSQVTGVVLSSTGVASWSDLSNEINYSVQLFKNGSAVGTTVLKSANETSHNFLSLMRSEGAGTYTVKVTAVGDGVSYSDGLESTSSTSQTILNLAKVNGLTWVGNTAHFDTVSDAVSYEVQLYKDGLASGLVKPLSVAAASAGVDFSSEMAAGGVGSYTFSVKAKGNTNLILDSVASNESAIKIETAKLPLVTNITLTDSGIVSWADIDHETGYQVQLYKDGVACGAPIIKSANVLTQNFITQMREAGAGSYTVTVVAKGDGTFYLDGTKSDPTQVVNVTKLTTVTQGMTWSNSIAKWNSVINASGYSVQLYKNGIAVGTPVIIASGNADSGIDFNTAVLTNGFGSYTYKVVAKGNESFILDSDPSDASGELIKKSVDSKATFDKNSDSKNHKRISLELQLDNSLVLSIKNGENALKTKTDYAISGNIVTIDKDYLDKLKTGKSVITILYSNGDKQLLNVTVEDTTSVAENESGSQATVTPAVATNQETQSARGTNNANTQVADSAGAAGSQVTQQGDSQSTTQQTGDTATNSQNMGNFEVKTEASKDVPNFIMPSNDSLYDAVLTEEDKASLAAGEKVEVKVIVEAIEEPEDGHIVKENLGDNQFGMYMDISVLKTVGGIQSEVHEMSEPITLTCDIPDKFKGKPEYEVLRVHQGEPTILADEDDVQDTITFSTDRCSTYALIYKDADTKSKGEVATVIQTETHSISLWVIILGTLIVGGMIVVYIIKRKKDSNDSNDKEETK